MPDTIREDGEYIKKIEHLRANAKNTRIPEGHLSDLDIKLCLEEKIIFIDANDDQFDADTQISGATIDLRLGTKARRIIGNTEIVIGNKEDEDTYTELKTVEHGYIDIAPHEVILVNTMECVFLPADFMGFLAARSSIARMGLMVHCCQSVIVPGHVQNIPLQLINLTDNTLRVHIGLRICQLALVHMPSPSATPYYDKEGSKYATERTDPIPSKTSNDSEQMSREHSRKPERLGTRENWVHKILYSTLFIGIMSGVVSGAAVTLLNGSSIQITVSGTVVVVIIILVVYILDWIISRCRKK